MTDAQRMTPRRYSAAIDEGLRSYMLRVYNYMAGGLALTGIVAYLTAQLRRPMLHADLRHAARSGW